MKNWMQMSREERNQSDDLQKERTFSRKKLLLDEIRKEYSEVSKIHHRKNQRKPFLPNSRNSEN